MEDALELARKLSVVDKRHSKMDAYFCFFRATNLKKITKIQNHKIPYSTATWSTVEDAAFSANRNDKRILSFYLKIKNMQNHEILYTTATWGSVEDALEPARKLGVAVNRHTKMDLYFYVFRATKFLKNTKCKITKYPVVRRRGALWKTLLFRQNAMTNEL